MTVIGLEAVAGRGRQPPAEMASDVENRERDIKAGIETALKRALTKRYPVDRDQEASKNRSPTKESVSFIRQDESYCLFCKKQIALPKGICMQCLYCFSNKLSSDGLLEKSNDGNKCDDIFLEKEELENLHFCTSCHEFTVLEQCRENDHLTLTIAAVLGIWCVSVSKQDLWSPIFEDVQIFRGNANVSWIPLHRQSHNSCIGCFESVNSSDVFCTFQCKAISKGTCNGWALALLHEDFAQDCRLNMVRSACPPTEFCSHCCLRHYLGKVTERIEVLRQGDASKYQQANEFKKNRFCIDCARSYCDQLCRHHIEHRTVGVAYIDSNYKHCLLVPVSENPWEATSAPFGAIQEVPNQAANADGYKVLPLKHCGSKKCLRCKRRVNQGVKWCSFDCRLDIWALPKAPSVSRTENKNGCQKKGGAPKPARAAEFSQKNGGFKF